MNVSKEEAIKLVKSGRNLAEASRVLKCSREYVRQILKKEGLSIKQIKAENPDIYRRRKINTFKCCICKRYFKVNTFKRGYGEKKFCSKECRKSFYSNLIKKRYKKLSKEAYSQYFKKTWENNFERKRKLSERMIAYWEERRKKDAGKNKRIYKKYNN